MVSRQVLAVAPRVAVHSGFLTELGLRAADHPSGAGEYLPCEPNGRTEVPGVWVAGNVTDPAAQVGSAAAAGAAAAINADLVAQETAGARAADRDPFSAKSEAAVCELVTDGRRRRGL